MEPTNKDEWYYAELLDLLNEKERQKEDSMYQPIELPLYIEPPQSVGDERPKDEETKDRGVTIIDL